MEDPTPTTAEVHGELLPPKTMGGHEDDDRRDVEAASHRGVRVLALKQEVVPDGTTGTFSLGSKGSPK